MLRATESQIQGGHNPSGALSHQGMMVTLRKVEETGIELQRNRSGRDKGREQRMLGRVLSGVANKEAHLSLWVSWLCVGWL